MTETEIMGVLFELHGMGITGINVYYSGGGDSGAIENVSYTKDKLSDLDIDHAFDEIAELNPWTGSNDLMVEMPKIWERLETFFYHSILDNIEDWWNNDGGYGNLCVVIPSGKFKIYNSIRYTETNDFFHEGELLEKAV